MIKYLVILAMGAFVVSSSNAQMLDSISDARPLSGVLPETIEKAVYSITGDIFISPGSTVNVRAGTVFLFKEFTGIHVQGALYVNGTAEEPVVFTSVNDTARIRKSSVQAAPFDWNGIDIYDDALGTTFNHCCIQYSVYGIRSQTEYLKLENVTLANNGRSDFTVKNERKEVTVPFSYIFEYKPVRPDTTRINIDTVSYRADSVTSKKPSMGVEPESGKKENRRMKVLLRVSGLALTLGGGALGAYFGEEYLDSRERFKELSVLDDTEKRIYTSKDWYNARDKRDKYLIKSAVSGGVAVIGLTSFIFSFAF